MRNSSTVGIVQLMARRKQQLEQRLATLLSDPEPPRGAIQETIDAHAQIAGYLGSARRRRSTGWLLGLAAAALAAAGLFSMIHLSNPRVVVTASTRAVIASVGGEDQEIAGPTRLTRLSHQGAAGVHDFCSNPAERGCTLVETLNLQSLTAFAGSEILLRRIEQCTDVAFLSGSGLLLARAHSVARPGSSTHPPAQSVTVRIKQLETVRFCGAAASSLVLRDPAFLVVGDSTAEAPSERTLLPAAAEGSILFADTGSTQSFRSTDLVQLGGLSDAVASVRLGKALDVTLSGRAQNIELMRSTLREDARPTWLDFVLGSPDVKTAMSLVIGLLVGLNLLRARLDELIV